MSDIDTKAIVLPSFKDFCYRRSPLSTTIVLDNNEHIDVKDIRVMFETIKKMNVSYIELLYTEFKIINDKYIDLIAPLFENRDLIAYANPNQFVRCVAGMSMEKRKALCHPYPNTMDKIERYGYDGKQLHHCARLCEFLYDVYNNNLKIQSLEENSKEIVCDCGSVLNKDNNFCGTCGKKVEIEEKHFIL